MTLTEKYIHKISPNLGIVKGTYKGNDSYSFPCPFCSHLPTKSGKIKSNKRTATFIPHQDCKYEYVFNCNRKGINTCIGDGSNGGMAFLNFLFRYNPYLAEKYKFEKTNT